jgi:hypothetical protein
LVLKHVLPKPWGDQMEVIPDCQQQECPCNYPLISSMLTLHTAVTFVLQCYRVSCVGFLPTYVVCLRYVNYYLIATIGQGCSCIECCTAGESQFTLLHH